MRNQTQRLGWARGWIVVCLAMWSSTAWAAPRVGVRVNFSGVSKDAQRSLEVQLLRRAKAVLTQARIESARNAQDLWVQATVHKRVDEDGNLGFDLAFVGRQDEQETRWPELARRCTFCTHRELTQTFEEALGALIRYRLPVRSLPLDRAGAHPVQTPTSAAPAQTIVRDDAAPPVMDAPAPRWKEISDRPRVEPPRTPGLRWWGWMGLGLSGAGAAGVVTSLATMPRNVPVPGEPEKMYPRHFDRGTTIGVALGAGCVVAGITLWLVDRWTHPRRRRQTAPTVAGRAHWLWEF